MKKTEAFQVAYAKYRRACEKDGVQPLDYYDWYKWTQAR